MKLYLLKLAYVSAMYGKCCPTDFEKDKKKKELINIHKPVAHNLNIIM